MIRNRSNLLKATALVALAAIVLPHALLAQLPSATGMESGVQKIVQPFIAAFKNFGSIALVAFGIYEAFKASRGGSGWGKAITCLVVAAVLQAIPTILTALGMNGLSQLASTWGF